MPTIAAFLLITLAPVPVNLDGISIERARHLSGRIVLATFLSVKPFDLHRDRQGRDWTILGAADRDDDARGVRRRVESPGVPPGQRRRLPTPLTQESTAVTDALSELKDACRGTPARSESETIGRGRPTRFRGRPAHAPEGTVAVAVGDDAVVIINDGDVLAVEKQGEGYDVAVRADAYVLLRIDKLLKATPQPRTCCGERPPAVMRSETGQKLPPVITIGDIELCELICFDFAGVEICVPVNCRKL